ncbi:MAG: hypothetical protein KDA24_10365 [Deltaproteobacteria bacterium]|nr:hypothetical protein [Deltaproteobacteria bacterium]
MGIRFVRWDIRRGDTLTPVVRLELDGVAMTDVGGEDCFESVLTAAEAAWRLGNRPPGEGSWIDAAQRAFDGASAGILSTSSTPRVITSQAMAHEKIKWLNQDEGLTPSTGEWALGNASGRAVPGVPSPDEFVPQSTLSPLSGAQTAEWALIGRAIEAAGPPAPGAPRAAVLDPPGGTPAAAGDLSGRRTAEWPFAGDAGRGEDAD